jgi:hypothetical protein
MILAPSRPTTDVFDTENEAPQHSVLKFQSMDLPPTAATSLSISTGIFGAVEAGDLRGPHQQAAVVAGHGLLELLGDLGADAIR